MPQIQLASSSLGNLTKTVRWHLLAAVFLIICPNMAVPITIRAARLFLGYRIFPDETPELQSRGWNLNRFWRLNAFFRQVEAKEILRFSLDGPPVFQELSDDPSVNQDEIVYYENSAGRIMVVRAELFGVKMPREGELTRRAKLARMLTSQEQFSRAFVNRMWGHFLSRGLNRWPAVDDFGELNPAEHPVLLEGLAKHFTNEGYDAKKLIRWICNSDAYQLQSTANASNGKKDAEVFFSRMPLKLISPEQLFDSILVASQTKALKRPEPRKKMRQTCFKHFFIYSGDEFADEVTLNHPIFDRHLQDLMTLIRTLEDQNALSIQDSETLTKALAEKNPANALDLLFLAALSRHPSPKETARFAKELQTIAKNDGDITQFWEDLFWALVNSSEFIMNH